MLIYKGSPNLFDHLERPASPRVTSVMKVQRAGALGSLALHTTGSELKYLSLSNIKGVYLFESTKVVQIDIQCIS